MSVKDRVSTAAEATAASVREIRPLALPDESAVPGRRKRRGRLRRMRETWIIPLAAAAVVAAIALVLVTLRHAEAPGPAPATGGTVASGIPRYFAIASEGPVSHGQMAAINVTVGDVRTGRTIATVALPAISELEGVSAVAGLSAAGDDRTFVAGRRDEYGDTDYFLVHITPGAKRVATVEHLPIPETALGVQLGMAVSPNGKDLAVLSARGNGTTLRIYSVESGAVLRTWTAGTWQNPYIQNQQGTTVSWTADNRQVAFSRVVYTSRNSSTGPLEERLISATAPSGDLATVSKAVLKAPSTCTSLLLTQDGGTVVCATEANYGFRPSPAGCGTNGPMFVAYSAATGQRLRVLYQYTGPCQSGSNTVLWSDDSARHVVGERQITFPGKPVRYNDQFG
ncbi:MAG: hypothetical protein ACRDP7_20500, partial [Trebonia sp.]